MSRKKKVIKNILSEIMPQLFIMILGLIRSKYYLQYLGGDTVGLVNLFNQIVGYLSLVEGGLGQAVIYKLCKPTKEMIICLLPKLEMAFKVYLEKLL